MDEYSTALNILGITKKEVLVKDVKDQYRKLIMMYHPDSYEGNDIDEALEKTQELNWAYSVLGIQKKDSDEVISVASFQSTIDDAMEDIVRSCIKKTARKKLSEEELDQIIKELCDSFFDNAAFWDGKPENKDATFKRGSGMGFPGGYYFWDPSYEPAYNFTHTLDDGIRYKFTNIVKNELGVNKGTQEFISYEILFLLYRNSVYSLAQDEYVRPYYCLGKLVESYDELKKIGTSNEELVIWTETVADNYKKSQLQKNSYDFTEATLVVTLEMPSIGNRTQTIESLSIGDELMLFVNPYSTEYSSEIELFTLDNRCVGRMPIPLSIAVGRLLKSGKLIASANVSHIETRAMRGPKARVAYATVNLNLKIIPPIEDQTVSNKELIGFFEKETIRLLKMQKGVVDAFSAKKDKEKYRESYLNSHYKKSLKGVYDKILFRDCFIVTRFKSGLFAAVPAMGLIANRDLYSLPDSALQILFETIEALKSEKVISRYAEETKGILRNDISEQYAIELSFKKDKNTYHAYISVFENQLMIEGDPSDNMIYDDFAPDSFLPKKEAKKEVKREEKEVKRNVGGTAICGFDKNKLCYPACEFYKTCTRRK